MTVWIITGIFVFLFIITVISLFTSAAEGPGSGREIFVVLLVLGPIFCAVIAVISWAVIGIFQEFQML